MFYEPDETGPEHGVCGGEELGAEGVGGGEIDVYSVERGLWDGYGGGGDAAEEEVVVVCHRGVVEEGGLVGVAGVFD